MEVCLEPREQRAVFKTVADMDSGLSVVLATLVRRILEVQKFRTRLGNIMQIRR